MKIIDTHCHYNMEPLYATWYEHWRQAQEKGVEKAIVVGTDLVSSQRAVEIAQAEPNLFAAVGIHPHDSATLVDRTQLENLLSQPKVIAVGETGLDYFRLPSDQSREKIIATQHSLLKLHIELAHQFHKLLIVHVRDAEVPEAPTPGNAYWDALRILAEHYSPLANSRSSAPKAALPSEQPHANALHLIEKYSQNVRSNTLDFILHCVSGPLTYIDRAVELGAYVGIAGNVTYKNAVRTREIVTKVPTTQLLLETDAPFLPPQTYRGQICEPWMITETAAQVATLLASSEEKLA